jgi:DNA modification methylase
MDSPVDNSFLKLNAINSNLRDFYGLFRFPGSFHPPLIKYLLHNYTSSNLIGDPLCGSGTVAIESIINGKNAVSMDIDPLSCLITKVKTNPINPEILVKLNKEWLYHIGDLPLPNQSNKKEALKYQYYLEENTKYRYPPNVFHWFDPYIIVGLAKCLLSIKQMNLDNSSTSILESIIASSIRRVSRADPQPVSGLEVTKIMKEKLSNNLAFNLRYEIINRCEILKNGYEYLYKYELLGNSIVYNGDILHNWVDVCKKEKHSLDLIITSPPYCNAIEYSRRHKLEIIWLGLLTNNELLNLSRNYIGSTTTPSKNNLNKEIDVISIRNKIIDLNKKNKLRKAFLIQKYFYDITQSINNMVDTLNDNGLLYLIVGPSTSYETEINTPVLINDICNNLNLKSEILFTYNIKNNRMQYSLRNNARIKTESVIKIQRK